MKSICLTHLDKCQFILTSNDVCCVVFCVFVYVLSELFSEFFVSSTISTERFLKEEWRGTQIGAKGKMRMKLGMRYITF